MKNEIFDLKSVREVLKKFGEGSVFRLSSDTVSFVPVIPTGSFSLDIALGVGGFPRGRIVEVYGPEQSGKTTLCLHAAANCQRLGGRVVLVDSEHALDPSWAKTCGVDVDDLWVSQPQSGEQALSIVEEFLDDFDLIIVDSVAALVPQAEIDGEMGDKHVGLQARLMSQAMRKLVGPVKNSNSCVIFTNQIRMKIGVMFGSPETTTGGQALKFYSSIRIDIRKREPIKEGEEVIGNAVHAVIKKNRVAPPFREANFEIRYDEGISRISELIELGCTIGTINKNGAWYSITVDDKEVKCQGTNGLRKLFKDDIVTALRVENGIRSYYGLPLKET